MIGLIIGGGLLAVLGFEAVVQPSDSAASFVVGLTIPFPGAFASLVARLFVLAGWRRRATW
jgi:hypothetical protein